MFHTGTNGNSLFVKIFTLRLIISKIYVSIRLALTNYCNQRIKKENHKTTTLSPRLGGIKESKIN